MAEIQLKMIHLYIFNLLAVSVFAYAIDSMSLCGTIDGSLPSKDDNRIFFKDKDHGVHTVEMNGTIIGCYPDASTVGATLSSAQSFIANVRKCAGIDGIFCTKDDSYPTDYVQYLLKKHWHMLAYTFASDSYEGVIDSVIQLETDVCDTYNDVIYPTSGQVDDGTELYIFNTPEHKQGVMISECMHRGQSCGMSENFPKSPRTECQQHYVYRELLALSPEGIPVKKRFKFPSFCMCAICIN